MYKFCCESEETKVDSSTGLLDYKKESKQTADIDRKLLSNAESVRIPESVRIYIVYRYSIRVEIHI